MFKSLILILFCVLLSVTGQLNLKRGVSNVSDNIKQQDSEIIKTENSESNKNETKIKKIIQLLISAFLNPRVIIGLFCYFAGMILWLLILSREDLSFAYPILGSSYILIVASSWLFLNEAVSPIRWLGAAIISLGVILIAKS
jgi:multidrug transporter EmrE-like cation transporter